MKTIKPILTATILSLALFVPVYAGDMSTPGAAPPPPPPPAICTTGDIQTPTKTTAPGDIGTPGIALNLLLAVLSLF
ncbi:MAG: hypothetical protein ACREBG_18180 [Pyrinomonadaceae bacterium]